MGAKRLIVTLLFTAILMGFFIWMISAFVDDAARKNRIWKEKAAKVTEATDYIASRNYDIMYYGEDLKGPSAFDARHIYDFEQNSLKAPDDRMDCVGTVIIVNDPHGDIPMTYEQWKILFSLMRYQDYIIIYLGSSQLETIQKTGFFFDVYPENARSAIFWNKGSQYEVGFADDSRIVPEVVREKLTLEQTPVYTMILKIASEKYF